MATLIVSVPVPISGDGIAVNVSSLVGEKTVTLSGTFKGQYVLFGSHNGTSFSPLATFDAGGVEGIERTFKGAVAWVRLRAMITESNGVTANVSGLSIPGDNSFGIFPLLTPGSSGTQSSVDLGLVAYQGDVNFIAQGGVKGSVVIEGSQDNIRFNPIGSFSAEPSSSSLLGGSSLVFSPLSTDDRIRYVRLNVRGIILTPFEVTIGGSQTSTGVGGGETLHITYEGGTVPLDQTLSLLDARGGKVIFDASDPGFTDTEAVQVFVLGGEGAAFLRTGGMVLGPTGIQIGEPGYPASSSGAGNTVIGLSAIAQPNYDTRQVVVGMEASGNGHCAIAIGGSDWISFRNTNATGDFAIALGGGAQALVNDSIAIGSNVTAQDFFGFAGSIAIGRGTMVGADQSIGIGPETIIAIGDTNIAIGRSCSIPFGYAATVIGASAQAGYGSNNALAIGVSAAAMDNNTIAIGYTATVGTGDNQAVHGIAIGTGSLILNAMTGIAIGFDSLASNGDSPIAIGNNAKATGIRAMAVGPYCTANSDGCLVFGNASEATWLGDIVIGTSSITNGFFGRRLVIGNNSSADAGDNVIAIGSSVTALGLSSLSIGSSSSTGGDLAIAIGSEATAGGTNSVALGDRAVVDDNYSVAIGPSVLAHGPADLVIGTVAFADSVDGWNVVIGNQAGSSGMDAVVIGDYARATQGLDMIVIGHGAVGAADDSIAIGHGANVDADLCVVIGPGAHVVTNGALPPPEFSIAIGWNAYVEGVATGSIVIGAFTTAIDTGFGAQSAIAIGNGANANHTESMAFGHGAVTTEPGEVVFDNNSSNRIKVFRAVSPKGPGYPDLFSFKEATLIGHNTTVFSLLIEDDVGGFSVKPVTLSAPVGGVSTLQVANP